MNKGRIKSIDETTLVIEQPVPSEETHEVTEEVAVLLDGNQAELTDLLPGDNVVLNVGSTGKVTGITATTGVRDPVEVEKAHKKKASKAKAEAKAEAKSEDEDEHKSHKKHAHA